MAPYLARSLEDILCLLGLMSHGIQYISLPCHDWIANSLKLHAYPGLYQVGCSREEFHYYLKQIQTFQCEMFNTSIDLQIIRFNIQR